VLHVGPPPLAVPRVPRHEALLFGAPRHAVPHEVRRHAAPPPLERPLLLL
jgi:hypothetical protein